jgi:hypothetical protein
MATSFSPAQGALLACALSDEAVLIKSWSVGENSHRVLRETGMPTLLRHGPYRFYVFSNEHHEPPHVHVDRDDKSAKIWLQPVSVARNHGLSPLELRSIVRLVRANQRRLLEAWHEHPKYPH